MCLLLEGGRSIISRSKECGLYLSPGRTPTRAFLKRRTPDTSQLFPALTVRAVHTLYPLTQSSLKPVWWVFLLPHFKAQEARGEGG